MGIDCDEIKAGMEEWLGLKFDEIMDEIREIAEKLPDRRPGDNDSAMDDDWTGTTDDFHDNDMVNPMDWINF